MGCDTLQFAGFDEVVDAPRFEVRDATNVSYALVVTIASWGAALEQEVVALALLPLAQRRRD